MSVSRKLRRAAANSPSQPVLSNLSKVLEVGGQLAEVSKQIEEVNGKLNGITDLVLEVQEAKGKIDRLLAENAELRFELDYFHWVVGAEPGARVMRCVYVLLSFFGGYR